MLAELAGAPDTLTGIPEADRLPLELEAGIQVAVRDDATVPLGQHPEPGKGGESKPPVVVKRRGRHAGFLRLLAKTRSLGARG
jgi:hypothetical protein